MKKLLLLNIWFLSVFLMAQVNDKPYEFPIKPGTEQWAKLTTSDQMDEVCIIPDQVLSTLSTKALLLTCLNYPRLVDFFSTNNMQTCFEFYSTHFNGLNELLNRPDLNKVLLNYYPEIDIQNYTLNGDNNKPSFLQISFFELLLAQDKIIRNYNNSEKSEILLQAIKNLETRKSKNESIGRQITTALIISRVINVLNNRALDKITNKDIYNAFNSSGIVLDTSIIDKILVIAKQF
ncbi:MAG: hypothetical protein NTZ85_02425 [Bacteroidia bacterium]|nr:hypothetical protein [Bacteroidia bacterium]